MERFCRNAQISIKVDEYIAEFSANCQKSVDEKVLCGVIFRHQTEEFLRERKNLRKKTSNRTESLIRVRGGTSS